MYDAIIVGAGPAGSSAARECKKLGLKTLLIDKAKFPRYKPCGGAVSEQALSYLDFTIPDELVEKECFGARVHFKGHTMEVVQKERIAVIVSRAKFDTFLLEKAKEIGVECLESEKVIDLHATEDYVDIVTEKSRHKGLYVVGADGVNSYVSKHVRQAFGKDEKAFSLVSSVPADNKTINERLDNLIEIFFGTVYMGYGWIFPHNGYYSVGIAGIESEFHEPKKAFLKFADSVGLKLDDVRGHFIPAGGLKRKTSAKRIALVGDAAGFVDPFYGEGIAYAILSGKLAAQSIASLIKDRGGKNENHFLSSYESECDKLINTNLKSAWVMSRLMHKYPNIFLRLFADNSKVLSKFLLVPSCKLEYRDYFRWLLPRVPFFIISSYVKRLFQK